MAIAAADWNQWPSGISLLRDLVTRPLEQPAASPTNDILRKLENTGPVNRRKVLVEYLRQQLVRVLGLDDLHFIEEREPLMRMGLDSLMAVEFRNQLSSALKRSLSATLLFDHPTIGALADFLGNPAEPAAPRAEDRFMTSIAELSDEEAEELLNKELEKS